VPVDQCRKGVANGRYGARCSTQVRIDRIEGESSTTLHREVVWQETLKAGTHTVRVVNKATAGHPRIDVDAVLNPAGDD